MNAKVGVSVSEPTLSVGDVAAPDLSQAPRLALEQWRSARGTNGNVMAWGCFRGDTTQWSADASELAFGKLAEIASGTAARMHGSSTPMHNVTTVGDRGNERALVGDAFADARARTFIVFSPGEVHACFVTCIDASCASALDHAEVRGPLIAPPPPGLALRSLGFVVHHPHGALGGLALSLAFAAAIAIGTRPHPRRHNRFPRQN